MVFTGFITNGIEESRQVGHHVNVTLMIKHVEVISEVQRNRTNEMFKNDSNPTSFIKSHSNNIAVAFIV